MGQLAVIIRRKIMMESYQCLPFCCSSSITVKVFSQLTSAKKTECHLPRCFRSIRPTKLLEMHEHFDLSRLERTNTAMIARIRPKISILNLNLMSQAQQRQSSGAGGVCQCPPVILQSCQNVYFGYAHNFVAFGEVSILECIGSMLDRY